MAKFSNLNEIIEGDRKVAANRRKRRRKKFVKDALQTILFAGGLCVAATSPYFLSRIVRKYFKQFGKTREYLCAFDYLKNRGLIKAEERNGQIYISLSKKGKKKAGKYQIDDLKIKKPGKWDGLWRVVIFDIPTEKRTKREAFRGKIKELGFYKLQKSVWVHPFECAREIELLRAFFGLNNEDIKVILAKDIGTGIDVNKFLRTA
jgi:CRISPR/Cas system-associated endoribonuclease Cas2